MPKQPQDEQLINRYIRDELTEAEQEFLNERLKDAAFQEELNLQKSLQKAFQVSGREVLKSRFQQLETNRVNEKKTTSQDSPGRVISINRWLIAAASVLLLVAAWWYFAPGTSTPDQLYAQYYEPYPNVVAPIQKGEPSENQFVRPYQLYERQEYREAIEGFLKLPNGEISAQFYLALSYLALEQPDCIEPLESLSRHKGGWQQAATWYLALAHLKFENVDYSKELLESIKKNKAHPFYNQAKILLEKLET